MKRLPARRLLAIGACLIVGGFLYDLRFAGIPDQDATPQEDTRYAFHARIASVMRWSGVAGICLGLLAITWRSTGGKP